VKKADNEFCIAAFWDNIGNMVSEETDDLGNLNDDTIGTPWLREQVFFVKE